MCDGTASRPAAGRDQFDFVSQHPRLFAEVARRIAVYDLLDEQPAFVEPLLVVSKFRQGEPEVVAVGISLQRKFIGTGRLVVSGKQHLKLTAGGDVVAILARFYFPK